jgi:hypothetical protein
MISRADQVLNNFIATRTLGVGAQTESMPWKPAHRKFTAMTEELRNWRERDQTERDLDPTPDRVSFDSDYWATPSEIGRRREDVTLNWSTEGTEVSGRQTRVDQPGSEVIFWSAIGKSHIDSLHLFPNATGVAALAFHLDRQHPERSTVEKHTFTA